MEENKESFNYTYSAKEQKEIRNIREKYITHEDVKEIDKMERLRCLDASVTKAGSVVSLTVGVVGTLVLGTGMSLVMTDLGSKLGMSAPLIPGVITGAVGICVALLSYPLYSFITKKKREKIAPEIIRLTDELMK